MTTTALNIRIGVLAQQAQAELAKLNANFERVIGKVKQMGHAFLSWQAASTGAGALVQIADAMSMLDARMKLAVGASGDFVAAKSRVIAIAMQAQAPLGETVTLFNRLAVAVREAGGSQTQALGITQAMTDALKISGATGAEASSAMLQFSRAMASGILRGEEFNAVNEAAPRVLKAVADALHVNVGALRQMAQDGKLTSDVVGNALLSQMGALRAEAARLPSSVGGALENLRTQFALWVDDTNNQAGATRGLADAINLLASNIKALSDLLVIVAEKVVVLGLAFLGYRALRPLLLDIGAAIALAFETKSIRGAIYALGDVDKALKVGLTGTVNLANVIKGTLLGAFAAWVTYDLAKWALDNFLGARLFLIAFVKDARIGWEYIEAGAEAMWAGISFAFESYIAVIKRMWAGLLDFVARGMQRIPKLEGVGKELAEFAKSLNESSQVEPLADRLKRIADAERAAIEAISREADAAAEAQIEDDVAKRHHEKVPTSKPGALGGSNAAPSTLAAENARAKAAADIATAQLKTAIEQQEALYQRGETGEQAYIEVKRQLAQQEISIEEAKQHALLQAAMTSKAPGAAEKAAAARAALAVLTEQRKQIDIQAAADQEQSKRQSEARITAIEAEGLRERGELVKAALLDWDQRNAEHLAKLRAQGAAGLAELNALMGERARVEAKAWEEQVGAAVEAATGRLDALRAQLDQEVTIGTKSRAQATSELRQETVALARDIGSTLIPQLEALIAIEPNPAKLAHLKQYLAELRGIQQEAKDAEGGEVMGGLKKAAREYAAEASDTFQLVHDVAANAFRGIENSLVEMVRTGKGSFKDLADSIIADIERIVIKEAIIAPIAKLLGAGGGGGGGGFFGFLQKGIGLIGSFFGVGSAAGGATSGAAGGAGGGGWGGGFAKGDVFERSPSLHRFVNTIQNKPTLFAFAQGGVFGEDGPEAVMPLSRDASGRLGVRAEMAGGSQMRSLITELVRPLLRVVGVIAERSRTERARAEALAPPYDSARAGRRTATLAQAYRAVPLLLSGLLAAAPATATPSVARVTKEIVTEIARNSSVALSGRVSGDATSPNLQTLQRIATIVSAGTTRPGAQALVAARAGNLDRWLATAPGPELRDAVPLPHGLERRRTDERSVTVNVLNYNGSKVETREAEDNRGNRRIDVMIGEMVASEMTRPNSPVHSATRAAYGLAPYTVQR